MLSSCHKLPCLARSTPKLVISVLTFANTLIILPATGAVLLVIVVPVWLPIFDKVLADPLIVLFVNVWVPVNVAVTVGSIEIVPVDVIGPPVRPNPVLINVINNVLNHKRG